MNIIINLKTFHLIYYDIYLYLNCLDLIVEFNNVWED